MQQGLTKDLTLLAFVKDGRSWVVVALLLRIRVHLSTRLVHAFLRHVELSRVEENGMNEMVNSNS